MNRQTTARLKNKKIILYDGDCNLCNRSVAFIRDRDRDSIFKPLAFQSAEGRDHAARLGVDPERPHSVVLVEENGICDRSEAGIRILQQLKGMRFMARLAGLVPQSFLNRIYSMIARHRHKIFGRVGLASD